MANLLILDASSSLCSVSLITERQQYHLCEDQPRRHAQRLLPMVDEVLHQAGVSRNELDGIAYGRGPGSFTGIRIAASVMQGISLALDLPVCGVSSLQTLAEEVAAEVSQRRDQSLTAGDKIAAVMDAHMGEVFWGIFEWTENGFITCGKEQVGAPDLCLQQLESFDGILVGDGLQLPAMNEALVAGHDLSFADIQPKSEFMANIVLKAWADKLFGNEAQHAPVYLRDSVAWKKLDEQPSLLKR